MKNIATPLHKINYLGVNVFVKRDDLYPVSGGGNKGRKTEYILERCVQDGCNAVVTCGGEQSNHARAVAIKCRELGIACTIVIHAKKTNNIQGNLKLLHLLGVKIVYCDISEVSSMMDYEMDEYQQSGMKPFYIWGGGHCFEGTKAFYDAVSEVKSQSSVHFDYVFHASGTGATQAGLHVGFKQHDPNTTVIGISVARQNPKGTDAISSSVKQFVDICHLPKSFADDIHFDDEYISGGYENTNTEQLNLIKSVAEETGIILDPTYTGKAWYGMTQYIKSGKIKSGCNILFWHTGGLLNLMAAK